MTILFAPQAIKILLYKSEFSLFISERGRMKCLDYCFSSISFGYFPATFCILVVSPLYNGS